MLMNTALFARCALRALMALILIWAATPPALAQNLLQDGSCDVAAPKHGVWFKSFVDDAGGTVNATLSQWLVAAAGGSYSLVFDAKREANFTAASWIVSLTSSGTGGTDWIDLLTTAPSDGS